jgi:hypothetical protein
MRKNNPGLRPGFFSAFIYLYFVTYGATSVTTRNAP